MSIVKKKIFWFHSSAKSDYADTKLNQTTNYVNM